MTDGPSSIPPQGPKEPHKPLPGGKKEDINAPKYSSEGVEYMGMSFTKLQWSKFLASMMNTMMSQMKSENTRMLKAIKKFKDQDN